MKYLNALPLALLLTLFVALPSSAANQIPKYINFQGQLTDSSGAKVNGNKSVTFAIYNVSSGGSALYSEAQSLTLSNGVGSALIGSVTALTLPFDTQYWLGVTIAGDAEMSPRAQLSASAYAFTAQQLADSAKAQGTLAVTDTLAVNDTILVVTQDGQVGVGTDSPSKELEIYSTSTSTRLRVTSAAVNSAPGVEIANDAREYQLVTRGSTSDNFEIIDGTAGNVTRLAINTSGNVGIGTLSPADSLTVTGGGVHISDTLSVDSVIHAFRYYGDGSQLTGISGGGADTDWTVDGSGNVYRTTGNVGIGTTSPGNLLHLYKSQNTGTEIKIENPNTGTSAGARLRLTNDTSSAQIDYYSSTHSVWPRTALIVNNDASGQIAFHTAGQTTLLINSGSNVGIGTITPGGKLHVSGNAIISDTFVVGSDSFIVTKSGNVGIGTTSPSDSLHVAGTLKISDSMVVADTVLVVDHVTGRVGIGLITPNAALEVAGDSPGVINVLRLGNKNTDPSTSEVRMVLDQGNGWYQGITGKYNSGAPFMALSVGSAANTWNERLRIDVNGNVGIGTTSPQSRLHTSGSDVEFRLQNTDAGGDTWKFIVGDNATGPVGGLFIQNPEHPTSNVLKISPAGALEVQGSVKARDSMQVGTGAGADSLNVYGGVHISDTLAVDSVIHAFRYYGDGSQLTGISGGGADTDWTLGAGDSIHRLSGNVGIGTGVPLAKLHLDGPFNATYGQMFVTSTDATQANREIRMVIKSSDEDATILIDRGAVAQDAEIIFKTSGTNEWAIGMDNAPAGNRQDFSIKKTQNANAEFLIDSAGKVGIATTNPSDSLHVAGTVKISDSLVVADTVFVVNHTTGRVGVGKSVPASILDIQGSGGVNDGINVKNSGTNAWVNIVGTGSTTNAYVITDGGSSGGNSFYDIRQGTSSKWAIGVKSTDNKLRFATTELNAATDAQTKLTIDRTTGNVGINTISPSDSLDVKGTVRIQAPSNGDTGFTYTDGTNTRFWIKGQNGGTVELMAFENAIALGTRNAGSIHLRSGDTDKITMTSGGNLGIGNSSPSDSLTISGGGVHISDTLSVDSVIYASRYYGDGSQLTGITASAGPDTDWTVDGSGNVVRTTGKIGIGTASPSDSLHVAGTVRFSDTMVVADTVLVVDKVNGRVGISTTNPSVKLSLGSNLNPSRILGLHTDNSTYFYGFGSDNRAAIGYLDVYAGGYPGNIQMSIGQNGRVGIGETIPTESLHVIGAIRASDTIIAMKNLVVDTNTFFVDATSDRVGVGTVSPNFPLSLGTSLANTKLAIYDNGSGDNIGLGVQSGQFRLNLNSPTSRFSFLDDEVGVELMTIAGNTGGVGIGDSTPTDSLTVAGGVHISDTLSVDSVIYASRYYGDGSQLTGIAGGSGPDTDWTVDGSGNVVRTTGKIGIGTASPTDSLHVVGPMRAIAGAPSGTFVVSSGGVGIGTDSVTNGILVLKQASDAEGGGLRITESSSSDRSGRIFMDGSGVFHIQRASQNNQLSLSDNGNVGIRTASPSDSLHVIGSIRADTLVIAQTINAASFVGSGAGLTGVAASSLSPANLTSDILSDSIGYAAVDDNQLDSTIKVRDSFQVGVDSFIVATNGRVGVGTNAPQALFHVKNTAGAGIGVVEGNGTAALQMMAVGPSSTFLAYNTDLKIGEAPGIGSNVTTRMFINDTGQIGIATITPNDTFHVHGNVRISDSLVVADTVFVVDHVTGMVGIGKSPETGALHIVRNWNTSTGGGAITLQGDKPTIRFDGTQGASSDEKWIIHNSANGSGGLEFLQGRTGTSWTGRILFTPTGRVGIGSSSPSDSLHVAGTVKIADSLVVADTALVVDHVTGRVGIGVNNPAMPLEIVSELTANDLMRIRNTNQAGRSAIQFYNNSNLSKGFVGYSNTANSAFTGMSFVGGAAGVNLALAADGVEKMRVTSDGKIGIGTTAPADSLHVVGPVRIDDSATVSETLTAKNIVADSGIYVKTNHLQLANGTNNDVALGGGAFMRISIPTGVFTLTGLAGGVDGRVLILYNQTANNMTINDEDVGSAAANRIITGTGGPISTTGTGVVTLVYDGIGARWIVTSVRD